MKINTGSGTISLANLIAIYSISMVTSLSGLAIAPILGDLESIFKSASQLQIQLLVSIPSIVIIPFVLLSGRLSLSRSKRQILIVGLLVFVFSSVLYLFSNSITSLLIISIFLGIGAGMVIPLSTGYIAYFFVGKERTKQLGISSAIANVSLVLATLLAGFLAKIDWHYAFMVYLLSIVSLLFAFTLKKDNPKDKSVDEPIAQKPETEAATPSEKEITTGPLGCQETSDGAATTFKLPVYLMTLYFFATLIALAVPQNISIYMYKLNIGSSALSGTLISLFFLAIMFPGFFITPILRWFGAHTSVYAFLALSVGFLLFLLSKNVYLLTAGILLVGLGYGVVQPMIYDRTSTGVPPSHATFALSLVMAMNYFAILSYPFVLSVLESTFRTKSVFFPFIFGLILSVLIMVYLYYKKRGLK